MFERFTERARQAVVHAQDEARALHHNYIGTEHLLLGLLRKDGGVAERALESLNVRADEVRAQVVRIVGQGDEISAGQIPFTPRAKRVLELSLREAQFIGQNYLGTEHLLLGLARENDGVAARILLDLGVDAQKVRAAVGQLLGLEIPDERTGPIPSDRAASSDPGRLHRGARRVEFRFGRMPRGSADYAGPPVVLPALFGWLPFGIALGIGILIGWLIWA